MASPSTRSMTLLSLAIAAAGCGGVAFTSGAIDVDGGTTTDDGGVTSDGSVGEGGASDGGASDAGSVWTTCPTSQMRGGACAPNGLECEYGNDPNAGCDAYQVCQSGAFQPFV